MASAALRQCATCDCPSAHLTSVVLWKLTVHSSGGGKAAWRMEGLHLVPPSFPAFFRPSRGNCEGSKDPRSEQSKLQAWVGGHELASKTGFRNDSKHVAATSARAERQHDAGPGLQERAAAACQLVAEQKLKDYSSIAAVLAQQRLMSVAGWQLVLKLWAKQRRFAPALALLQGTTQAEAHMLDMPTLELLAGQMGRSQVYKEALTLLEVVQKRGLPCSERLVAYTMQACRQAGEGRRALAVFQQLESAGGGLSAEVLREALLACGPAGECQLAQRLLSSLRARGQLPSSEESAAGIEACRKGRQWKAAIALLEELELWRQQAPSGAYHSAMVACKEAGQWGAALGVALRAHAAGCCRTASTLSLLLAACQKGAAPANVAAEIFVTFRAAGIVPDTAAWTALVNACGAAGDWAAAEWWFRSMQEEAVCVPNEASYCALISAYARGGQWLRGLAAFEELQAAGGAPGVVTWSAAISCAGKGGSWKLPVAMLAEMKGRGVQPNEVTYVSIIQALGAGKQWELGERMFAELAAGAVPSLVAFSALAAAYSSAHRWAEAWDLVTHVMPHTYGLLPDKFCYTSLINACGKCRKCTFAAAAFQQMLDANIEPDGDVYTALIRAYEASGQYRKAMQVFENMKTGL